MRRSVVPRYTSLTSLLDVLFILIFASMVQATDAGRPAAASAETGETDMSADAGIDAARSAVTDADAGIGGPDAARRQASHSDLREWAIANLTAGLRGRRSIFVRVAPEGVLRSIEHEVRGEMRGLALGVPLLERVPDSRVELAYLGDRTPQLRICNVVRYHLQREALVEEIVVIVPDRPLASLSVALVRGLRRDQERCYVDTQGLGVVVNAAAGEEEGP